MAVRHQTQLQAGDGWQAELRLRFANRSGRTVLAGRSQYGPLSVQRAFYPEGGVPHLYLLHPPGGVVGGDSLKIEATVDAGAHALITTPAAGKFYRCDGRQGVLQQQLRLEQGACLEWLPQETIVYEGAQADSLTRVELATDSRFIGWEMVCLGRPAAGEGFGNGSLRQRLEIWREGRPVFLERARFQGGGQTLTARWGMAGLPLAATLVAVGVADLLESAGLRELSFLHPDEQLSVTALDEDVLVCRYLGRQAQRARQRLATVWARIRPQIMQRPACEPRVWNT